MRALVLSIVVASVAACAYDDPSYEGTSFMCSDDAPCPAGQTCIAGRCETTVSTADGVACGSAGVCEAGEQCCASVTGGPSCQPEGDTCAGQAATCDGREDCGASEACCGSSDPVCQPSGCSQAVCSDNADCGGVTPTCCRLTFAPWGLCSVC